MFDEVIEFADVNEGDLGGFIESEDNLSHSGDAKIYGDAWLFGDAWISGRLEIFASYSR